MTTPSAEAMESPVPAAKPAALWEDFIDIFYAPSSVYERRRNANPWPMILIVTALMTVIGVLTWNSLSGIYDAEARAQVARMAAGNPQMTQDMMDSQVKIQMFTRRWGGVMYPIGILVIALPIWLLARIVGAKEMTYTRSLVVIAWASIIGVVGMLATGVQGLVLNVSSFTTADQLTLSAARFLDKATASPLVYAAAKSLDLFAIWSLIVMAIGVRVVGRSTKNGAIAFAVTWFVVALLIAVGFAARTAAAAAG
jgi:hypothetical protein